MQHIQNETRAHRERKTWNCINNLPLWKQNNFIKLNFYQERIFPSFFLLNLCEAWWYEMGDLFFLIYIFFAISSELNEKLFWYMLIKMDAIEQQKPSIPFVQTSICISIQSHSLCIRCVYHASFTASSSYFSLNVFVFFCVCAEWQHDIWNIYLFTLYNSTQRRRKIRQLFFCTSNNKKKGRKIH